MIEPTQQLSQSADQHEAQTNRTLYAKDIAYTLNHAISCGTNDMLIAPTISALFGVQVGCADPSHKHAPSAIPTAPTQQTTSSRWKHYCEDPTHDHGRKGMFSRLQLHPEPAPHTPHVSEWKFSWPHYRREALHYLKGEIMGDALAVPLTFGVQRFFPSLMDGIRDVIEPVAAPFFRTGAHAAARRWAAREGYTSDMSEVTTYAQSMYKQEIQHLPQAVVWNVFAFPIGVMTQKMGGQPQSYARIIRNKSLGAVISNTLLLGARAIVPDLAQQWDAMNSQHLITPAARFLGRLANSEDAIPTPNYWTNHIKQPATKDKVRTS